MTSRTLRSSRRLAVAAIVAVVTTTPLPASVAAGSAQGGQPATSPAFRILVVAGENAVNIVQQRTAVSPVVEVRDRNNAPMAGVPVTFTIGGNNAAFGANLQAVTVTTNAAGRAAAGGMTPVNPGVVQIQASASVQGQTASALITQTNFATVAAATAAGAAVGAAAGAGATGGGLSATTIGIIAGAAGGGTLAARQLTKDPEPPAQTTFAGSFSVQRVKNITIKATSASCTQTWRTDGTLTMTIDTLAGGAVSGSVDVSIVDTVLSTTCAPGSVQPPGTVESGGGTLPVTGTTDAVQFINQRNESDAFGSFSSTFSFLGTLGNGTVSGTITSSEQSDGPTLSSSSSMSIPVTLR